MSPTSTNPLELSGGIVFNQLSEDPEFPRTPRQCLLAKADMIDMIQHHCQSLFLSDKSMCNSHPVQPMYLVLANVNIMNAKFKFNQA